MKKIFLLLPHKEQFSTKTSGSASIWARDFIKISLFKNDLTVYGSNVKRDDISIKKVYQNINIKDLKYQSKTNT